MWAKTMRFPKLTHSLDGQIGNAKSSAQKLLESTSIKSAPNLKPELADPPAVNPQEAIHSIVDESATLPSTTNPNIGHSNLPQRTAGLESGDDAEQLLRQEEAALLLGVSPRCLENWRYRGGGPAWVSYSTRCIRYRKSDLQKFVQERVKTNTSDDAG